MKKSDKETIRFYAWIELIAWLIIISLCVFGIRFYHYQHQKQFKHYQIFMQDADGLIVGSPVKFLGIQIGYVTKIQIVSTEVHSDIYVKFIITQKDLNLPTGAIATVEGSGLGGSKALEIYPPKEKSDKLIVAKDSTRLSRVMSLFKAIFKDFEEIFTTLGYAGKQLYTPENIQSIEENVVTPAQANDSLGDFNNKLDEIISARQKLRQKMDKIQKQQQTKPQKPKIKGDKYGNNEQQLKNNNKQEQSESDK